MSTFVEESFLVSLITIIYMLLAIPYLFSLWELAASLRIKRKMKTKQKNVRGTNNFDATIIVSAYLPNEQDVILHTIKHMLRHLDCPGNLQIILAFNTSKDLPVEEELKRLSLRDKRFEVLRVDGSSRKATNMNAAVQRATGQIIAFFDADAKPEPDCLMKAHGWIRLGYDFVQGANLIQNRKHNWITRIISIEFLEKYFVSYLGRFLGAGVTYFTGSNAYWRSSVLQELTFSTSMQLEDISASIRCMLEGKKLAFAPDIRCYEFAPVRFVDWWKQRRRWAIGWSELTKQFQKQVLCSSELGSLQKAIWTYFLTGRRIILPVLQCSVPALAAPILFGGGIWFFVGLNFALSALALASSFGQGFAVRKTMPHSSYLRLGPLLAYALFFPVYDSLRNLTIARGIGAFFLKETKWEVTPRREQPLLTE